MSSINEKCECSPLLALAQTFNNFDLLSANKDDVSTFLVSGKPVGLIKSNVLQELMNYGHVFRFGPGIVELKPQFQAYSERSEQLASVLQELRKKGIFAALEGWRNECFEVKYAHQPLLEIERSATSLFGVRKYGVDINGFVRHPERGLCIWLQQRSFNKPTWPGKWDNLVGGGLAVGYGIRETAIKESAEEASIPRVLAQSVKSVNCLSYFFESQKGLFPNTEYIFDLELPINFEPKNADGEVHAFALFTASECYEMIFKPEFKTTSCPVVIDFLIRHGVITADNEKFFTEIVELLHVPLDTFYKCT